MNKNDLIQYAVKTGLVVVGMALGKIVAIQLKTRFGLNIFV